MRLLLSLAFVAAAFCFSIAHADQAAAASVTTPASSGSAGDVHTSAISKPLADLMSGLKELIVPRPGTAKQNAGQPSSKTIYAGPAPRIGFARRRARKASNSAVVATSTSNVMSMAYLSSSEQAKPAADAVEALRRLAAEGPAAPAIQIEASSASQEQPAPDANSSYADVPIQTSSVCAADPPFQNAGTDGYSRTTCRLFIYGAGGETYLCTAWFVSPTHAVTAGHCVARRGVYIPNPTNPGRLCCAFDNQGQCLTRYAWRMTHWVTTEGYWKHERSDNDGAVIRVVPESPSNNAGPVPQELISIFPKRFPVGMQQVYLDGYPARTTRDLGCENIIPTSRYYTQAYVTPLGTVTGTNGARLMFALSGCLGESGGRVLLGGSDGAAFGIQTFGDVECWEGRGMTGVTQIINTAAAENGVCISCLQGVLP